MRYLLKFEIKGMPDVPYINTYTLNFAKYFAKTPQQKTDWEALSEYIENNNIDEDNKYYDTVYQFIVDKFSLNDFSYKGKDFANTTAENRLAKIIAAFEYTFRDISFNYDEALGNIEDFWMPHSDMFFNYKTQNPNSDLMKEIEKIKKYNQFDL